MKPMANDTKPDISTVIVQTAPEPKRSEEAQEKRKKLKIIAITAVVLVAIVTAAIVTVVFVVGKHAEDTIKIAMLPYMDESGKTSTQKVTVNSREEKFEIAGSGMAVFDFDKSLLAYKPDNMAKPTCFLTAVNTSTLLSPEKLKALLGDTMASNLPSNSSDRAEYMSSGVVVPNKDFLSPMSKQLWKDNEVVWMVPSSGIWFDYNCPTWCSQEHASLWFRSSDNPTWYQLHVASYLPFCMETRSQVMTNVAKAETGIGVYSKELCVPLAEAITIIPLQYITLGCRNLKKVLKG